MEVKDINTFFELNETRINEKFVDLLMEKMGSETNHGDKTTHNFREGGSRLTGVVRTALVTSVNDIVDYQMEWTMSHIPLEGYSFQNIKDMMTLYKDIIQQEYPQELVKPSIAIIDRMLSQMGQ